MNFIQKNAGESCRGNLEIFISLNFVIYSRRKEKFVTDEI